MPTKTKPKADELMVCFESFASHEHQIARGTKLRGDNPLVERFSQFFIPADTPDDEWPRPSFPPPPEPLRGRFKLRILEGAAATKGEPRAWHKGQPYYDGETLTASDADAAHLLDAGVAEIVKRLKETD